MNLFNEIKVIVDQLQDDMDKFFDKGNKTAGTRARKSLQDLKALAQEIRVQIQNSKKA